VHTYQDESLCGCNRHREGSGRKQGIVRRRFDLVAEVVVPRPENESEEDVSLKTSAKGRNWKR